MTNRMTVRFRVYGIVQGVGFRPTVDRHAAVAGSAAACATRDLTWRSLHRVIPAGSTVSAPCCKEQPPKRAAILKIDEKPLEETTVYDDFQDRGQ